MMILRACGRMFSTAVKKQRVLVTGGTNGIGCEAAEQMSKLGHDVTISGRDRGKANTFIEKCATLYQNKVKFIECDLSSIKETSKFADLVANEKFDIYIMNAGTVTSNLITTADGYDRTMMVNLIAPYMICQKVLQKREENQAVHFVFVTSILLKFYSVSRLGNYIFDPQGGESWQKATKPEPGARGTVQYMISKIGQAVMAAYVNGLNLPGVTATSVHPGTVLTGIIDGLHQRHQFYVKTCRFFVTSKEKAGSNLVQAALSPLQANFYYLGDKQSELPKVVCSTETISAITSTLKQFK